MERTGHPETMKGLSRFLVEHESCSAGFDVSHPDGLGSGRVSMKCRGCGATYEYGTATIEFEREVEFAPVVIGPATAAAAGAAASPPPASAPIEIPGASPPAALEPPQRPGVEVKPPAPPEEKVTQRLDAVQPESPAQPPAGPVDPGASSQAGDSGGRWWETWSRERLITVGLVVFAAAALAFAIVRLAGGDDGAGSAGAPASPTGGNSSNGAPAGKAKTQQSNKSQTNREKQQGSGNQNPSAQAKQQQSGQFATIPTAGEKVVRLDRFALIVPESWEPREAAGGFVLAPPGDAMVSVQIYYENDPSMSRQAMTAQTAEFLRSRDAGADVQPARRLRVGRDPAFELRANGPAGTQVALGVLSGPYRYLVIESVDPGAPDSARRAGRRAVASFRPN